MRVNLLHEWPASVAEAVAIQERLRPMVDSGAELSEPATVAGVDVAYALGSDRLAAAVVVLDARSLEVVQEVTALGEARFPYLSGLLAFRELPTLVAALERLTVTPDAIVCDAQGLAHPRRFGLACHLGVLTGLPSVGVAKTSIGPYDEPADRRGASTALVDHGETVGRALRTHAGVKPVFVSVGHRMTLDAACELVLRLSPRYRLPETTRKADRLSRAVLG
jgi:deoxyribonuclease V